MIVYGPDVIQWTEAKMQGYGFDNPFGLGIIKDDKLVGGVVYDNYRPAAKTVSVSIALTSKTALTKDLLKRLFAYPFIDLGCNRLMATIDVNNHPSLKLCRALGFTQEGTLRKASPAGSDLAIFGMLRDECRWLTNNLKDS